VILRPFFVLPPLTMVFFPTKVALLPGLPLLESPPAFCDLIPPFALINSPLIPFDSLGIFLFWSRFHIFSLVRNTPWHLELSAPFALLRRIPTYHFRVFLSDLIFFPHFSFPLQSVFYVTLRLFFVRWCGPPFPSILTPSF